ncbi:MAG: Lrp/AsnC family transcriptional regulator [Reyranella sp.]|nr:MAG: Lrp/AsnC family transcriptional regulator [Reyranella sp.]
MQTTLTPWAVSQCVMVQLSRPPEAANAIRLPLRSCTFIPASGSFCLLLAIGVACRFVDRNVPADGSSSWHCARLPSDCRFGDQSVGSRQRGGLDSTDQELIRLLTANAREPVTTLARKLNLARATIQERIDRLKRNGVISRFTIEVKPEATAPQITACVFVKVNLKASAAVGRALSRIKGIRELYKTAGENDDFLAIVDGADTAAIDATIGEIVAISGVERTSSKIMLARVR